MPKSISTECSACGAKFRITSSFEEPVAYCPYCADPALLPHDEAEDELDDADDDLREFNPDDDNE